MPKAGAFDKAKKKGSGGFGASKSGRFDAPKESCDFAPSASAYNAFTDSIGAKATKSAQLRKSLGASSGGFGSTAKRMPAPKYGTTAPGPGAYADAITSEFKKPGRQARSGFGSTAQHDIPATVGLSTPAPGTYAAPTGLSSVKVKGPSTGT